VCQPRALIGGGRAFRLPLPPHRTSGSAASTESLGRTYVFMALAALAVISIDQTAMRTLTSTARIALDGTIGAALALAVFKFMGFARRSQ